MKKPKSRQGGGEKPPPFIGTKYEKFVAVGCSHGKYIDPTAKTAVLGMVERWNPNLLVRLRRLVPIPRPFDLVRLEVRMSPSQLPQILMRGDTRLP
jgi:hypothetical protein